MLAEFVNLQIMPLQIPASINMIGQNICEAKQSEAPCSPRFRLDFR